MMKRNFLKYSLLTFLLLGLFGCGIIKNLTTKGVKGLKGAFSKVVYKTAAKETAINAFEFVAKYGKNVSEVASDLGKNVNKRYKVVKKKIFGTIKPREFPTINSSLKGKAHPETGVPFKERTVRDYDGNPIKGVFAQFKSNYDCNLPKEMYKAKDAKQFAYANEQLQKSLRKNPDMAKRFNPEQLEQIKNGDTPDGYTWHHSEKSGKLQLVDTDIHQKTGHTGGRHIWGGGTECRK